MTLNDVSRVYGESAKDLGDKYTMNDAARIKGVSYHTVSRAVRTGRLRAERLGRMALISPGDLEAWQPKRERAPKRFRERNTREAGWLEQVGAAPPEEIVTDLAGVFRELHQIAVQESAAEVGRYIARYIAQILGLTRVTIWAEMYYGTWHRLATHGGQLTDSPDTLQIDRSFPSEPKFTRAQVIADLRLYLQKFPQASVAEKHGPVLVLPMGMLGKNFAFAMGDIGGQPLSFSPRQLEMAEGLAANLAFILEHALIRERGRRKAVLAQTTMGTATDGIRILDAKGEVDFANDIWTEMFGGDWTWTCATDGKPLEDHGMVEQEILHLNGVDRNGRKRAIMMKSIQITLDGEVIGLSNRATDQAERREREATLQRELERMQATSQRFDAMNSAMMEIGQYQTTREVVNGLVSALVTFMGADNGAAMLRNETGKFAIVTNVDGILTDSTPRMFDPISVPSTIMALAQGTPLVVHRRDATSTEQWCMIAFQADTKVIIPVVAGEMTIGAVYLFFRKDVALDPSDLDFAVDLATRCARLIDHLHLIEHQNRAEEYLREIIDQFPQALLLLDYPTLQVTNANRVAMEMFAGDLQPGQDMAPHVHLLDAHGDELVGKDHPVTRTILTGESIQAEPLLLVREDGRHIEILASHVLLQDHAGRITGVMCIYQDRANMNRLDAERDEFLGVVAHELRNPLTSLRGNLQLLQRRMRRRQQEPQVQEDLSRVETVLYDVDRIADLLGRMLDVSRVRRGTLDLSFAEADAVSLVESVATSTRGAAPGREIITRVPEALAVTWDRVRIEQVVRNLLNNAVTHTESGAIEVGLSVSGATVDLTVRDHGSGVPDNEKQRLFQRYYRTDDNASEDAVESEDGLGVGLYLSERIARAHGGSLTVEDASGGGALFRLKLPVRAGAEADTRSALTI